MRGHPLGRDAQILGSVTEGKAGMVTMKSRIGATRIVDMLSGEQLAPHLLMSAGQRRDPARSVGPGRLIGSMGRFCAK